MKTPLKKRMLFISLGAAGGAAIGWLQSFIISSCDGTCAVGTHPLLIGGGLAMVGAYAAFVGTRPQPQ